MGHALLLQRLYKRVMDEVQPGPKAPPGEISKILEIQGRAQFGLLHFQEGCKLFAESLEKDPKYVPTYWGLARCAAARGKLDEARANLDKAVKLDEKNSGTWALVGDLERTVKHYPEAELAYANALKYNADNIDALLARAAARIDNNKLAEATQDIDAASKYSRDHPIVNQLRGVVQYKQGKFAEAKTSFETVLKVTPDYLPAVLWLGLTDFWQGDYEQAAKQFGQYTRRVPGATQIRALLALAQARLGRGPEAQDTLNALKGVDIKDPQSLAALAQAHAWLGETAAAAAYLTKAVEQKPEAANLRTDLAATLMQKGDRAQAIEQLEDAIRLDPGLTKADALLIQNLIQEKQFEKAMDAVEALEKKQPQEATTFNLKGAVYLGMNDLANARKSFEHAMELQPTSVAAAVNLAQLDVQEKKPAVARQRFEGMLAKDKDNVQVMLGLAGIAAVMDQDAEHVAWLQKAAKAAPSAVRPRLLLGHFYLRKGDATRALAVAQDAQTANPDNTQALDLLGTAQLAVGETQNAITTYGKLARLVPGNPVVHYRLATAQAAGQSMEPARASLNRALALKPDYLPAEILLASIEIDTGRYGEALKITQRIQRQHPQAASGFALQGNVLLAQKQFLPALKAYERAFEINRSGLLVVQMHKARSAAGRSQEADAKLRDWLEEQPNDVAARTYLAAIYLKAGQHKLAIEQYQRLLQADAKSFRALNDLAWLYQKEKDPRAVTIAEQGYQLYPDNPDITDTLGWILLEQGENSRALELLRKAAEKVPQSTEIRYHLAVALAKSGDNARARGELTDLLANKNFRQRQEAQALLKQL